MTISTIGTLQTAVESWLERTFDDALFLEFANNVADKLNHGVMGSDGRNWIVPPLRLRSMLTAATIVTSGAAGAIPAALLEFERIWIDANDGRDLLYVPLLQFRSRANAQMTGTPSEYTIDGATLYVAPTSDATLQVSYYTRLGAFTGDASTDAVLTNHPRAYQQGVLEEALGWVGDFERANYEGAKFAATVKGLAASDRQAKVSGSLLVMRPQSVA